MRYYIEGDSIYDRRRGDQPLFTLVPEGEGRAAVASLAEQEAVIEALNDLDARTRRHLSFASLSQGD